MKILIPCLALLVVLYCLPSSYMNTDKTDQEPITVSVQGAVEKDTILQMPRFSTINDVLEQVKLSEQADLTSLNRLAVLKDGDVLVIPEKTAASKVSINTASIEELMSVPGIGQNKASLIVAYRQEHGLFQKLEDLMKISGIKEKTFAKLKPYLCL